MLNGNRFSVVSVFVGFLAISALGHNAARSDWQQHSIREGDGHGGWITHPAERQVLKHPNSQFTMPFGLVSMDNCEIALFCSREKTESKVRTVEAIIAFSKDKGATWSDFWSEMQFLFYAGRHHANLQRLPNGNLVCTLVVRDDIQGGKIQDGKLTSRRRGCDALISKDDGKTWNLDRRYELDSFDFLRQDGYWVDGMCGHIGAVALPDGHVISAYGHYQLGASVLIKWKPDDEN